jgi:hypothetical protein
MLAPVDHSYATAADLAHIYQVARGTIWAWASQDKWRRTRTRPVRYSRADAEASWQRRHGQDWRQFAARPDE